MSNFKMLATKIKSKLHIESFGNKTNQLCLLISGSMSSARFWTHDFCKLLSSAGFFVVRYDNRDIGESPTYPPFSYDIFDLADDAISILDHYGVKSANIVGHSMGGYIAQIMALKYPERAKAFTFVSSGLIERHIFNIDPEETKILQNTWKILSEPKDNSSLENHIESFMKVWKHLNGSVEFDQEMARSYTIDLITRGNKEIKRGNNHELSMHKLFQSLMPEKSLSKIKQSALVIHGTDDKVMFSRQSKLLSQAIPRSSFLEIDKMGHMIFNKSLEERIADAVIQHFSSNH